MSLLKVFTVPELYLGYEEDVTATFEGEQTAPLAEQISALQARGFERLGVKWENSTYETTRSRMVTFVAPQLECFAGWHRDAEAGMLFHALTGFENGGYVLTWSGGAFADVRAPGATCTTVRNGSPEDVLAAHAREVAAMKAAGGVVRQVWNREGRLEATRQHYAHPETPVRITIETIRFHLFTLVIDALIIAGFIASFFTLSTPVKNVFAAVVCSATVAYWFSFFSLRRRVPKARISALEVTGSTIFAAVLLSNFFS